MSTYVESSIISRLNRSEGDWFQVDDLFMRVLLSAIDVAQETEGAFDPTIGSVVQFDRQFIDFSAWQTAYFSYVFDSIA